MDVPILDWIEGIMGYRFWLPSMTLALMVVGIVEYTDGRLKIEPDHRGEINSRPAAVSQEQKMQPLDLLAARLNDAARYRPTAQEAEEDNRYFRDRVAAIKRSLSAGDAAKRSSDTERLGAYRIPESIELLAVILETDPDPAVREMAARTLGRQEPEIRSIDALLGAAEDPSEPVQSASLLGLELLLNRSATKAPRVQIIRGLERIAGQRFLPPRLQANLAELLSDRPAID